MTAPAIPWDRPIPIGNSPRGVVHFPPTLHTLLGGATNAGKSGVLNVILAGLAQREHTQIVLLDPKRVEMPHWQWGARAACIATGRQACLEVIARVRREMERRYAWSEQNRKKVWVPSEDRPRLIMVIDELAELIYKGETAQVKPLQSVLAMGRAAGVMAINATQRPDVETLPGTLRDNHRLRICLGTESQDGTKMILGPEGGNYPAHLIPESSPGVGYLRVDRRFTKFRAFYLPEERLEQVIAETAHLRRDLEGFEPHVQYPDDDPPISAAKGRRTATAGRS